MLNRRTGSFAAIDASHPRCQARFFRACDVQNDDIPVLGDARTRAFPVPFSLPQMSPGKMLHKGLREAPAGRLHGRQNKNSHHDSFRGKSSRVEVGIRTSQYTHTDVCFQEVRLRVLSHVSCSVSTSLEVTILRPGWTLLLRRRSSVESRRRLCACSLLLGIKTRRYRPEPGGIS